MSTFNDDDHEAGPAEGGPESSRSGGERKAVEAWATAKGLYPEVINPPAATLPPGTLAGPGGTVPVLLAGLKAPANNPNYWRFAAARAMHGWVIGAEVTEAEFDAAIEAATTAIGG